MLDFKIKCHAYYTVVLNVKCLYFSGVFCGTDSCVPTLLPHQPRHNAVNVDRTSDQFAISLTLSNIKVATLTLPRNGVDT